MHKNTPETKYRLWNPEEKELREPGALWAAPDEIDELFELPLNNRVGADCWRRCSPRGRWTKGSDWCFHKLKIHPKPCEIRLRCASTCSVRTPGSVQFQVGKIVTFWFYKKVLARNGVLRVTVNFPPSEKYGYSRKIKLSLQVSVLRREPSISHLTFIWALTPMTEYYRP